MPNTIRKSKELEASDLKQGVAHGSSSTRLVDVLGNGFWKTASILFVVFSVGWGAAYGYFSDQIADKKNLEAHLRSFEFSTRFLGLVPGDVDLFFREIKIGKQDGASVSVLGPDPNDRVNISLTKLEALPGGNRNNVEYIASVVLNGSLGLNMFSGLTSNPIKIVSGEISRPIGAGQYQFFVYVDRIDVDWVYLSLARRRIKSGKIQNVHFSHMKGDGVTIIESLPEPLLCKEQKS